MGLHNTTGGVSKEVMNLTKCLADMEERDRASKDAKAANSKYINALAIFGARETNPRMVWDESKSRSGRSRDPRLTTRIKGRIPQEGIPLLIDLHNHPHHRRRGKRDHRLRTP